MFFYKNAFSEELHKVITAREARELARQGKLSNPHAFHCCGADTCHFPLTCANMLQDGKMAPHFRPSSRTAQHVQTCDYAKIERQPVPKKSSSSESTQSRNPQNRYDFVLNFSTAENNPTSTDSTLPARGKRRLLSENGSSINRQKSRAPYPININNLIDLYYCYSVDDIEKCTIKINGVSYAVKSLFCPISDSISASKEPKIYFGMGTLSRTWRNDGWRIKFDVSVDLYYVIKDVHIGNVGNKDEIKYHFSALVDKCKLFFVLGQINESNGTFYINPISWTGPNLPVVHDLPNHLNFAQN